jgi:radical SAM superfamily enzyme YgiQ (UPF0313 family)
MKRITMINPNMASYRSGDAMQPLVFAILKSLTPPGFEVTFFDDRIEEIDYEHPTDLVAISVGTFTARQSYKIAAIYREKGTPVVMGGYHATLLPQEVKQHADAVVVGSAENIWIQLLEDFANNCLKPFYQSEENNPEFLETSYDYSIFNGKKYFPLNLVEWGRGCRHNCDFCCIQAFNNGKEILRPIEDVINDIGRLDHKPIFFVDDNLYHNKKHFREFLKDLIPLKRKWACQISVDVAADDELLDLMQQSGCLMVLLGIESLKRDNLKMMNKGWNISQEKYTEALRKFRKRHIMIYGAFIFGYDHDTPDDFKASVDFAIKNKLFIANFNPLYPMPGTPLYDRLEKEERLVYEKWWTDPAFYYGKTMFRPTGMTPEELESYCFKAKKQFNSIRSILYRSTNLSANMYGFVNPAYFIMANYTNRKEVYKKQGKKLGES